MRLDCLFRESISRNRLKIYTPTSARANSPIQDETGVLAPWKVQKQSKAINSCPIEKYSAVRGLIFFNLSLSLDIVCAERSPDLCVDSQKCKEDSHPVDQVLWANTLHYKSKWYHIFFWNTSSLSSISLQKVMWFSVAPLSCWFCIDSFRLLWSQPDCPSVVALLSLVDMSMFASPSHPLISSKTPPPDSLDQVSRLISSNPPDILDRDSCVDICRDIQYSVTTYITWFLPITMLMFVILMVVCPAISAFLQKHFAENETLGWPRRHLDVSGIPRVHVFYWGGIRQCSGSVAIK